MASSLKDIDNKNININSDVFFNKLNADMHYKSEFSSDSLSFDWLNEIELACPYIDNIVRNPKLTLISEENVYKIEKVKKITVESVKDLTRHTNYIERIDKKTKDVQPSKLLDVRSEDTFNTYENRFVYTLLDNLTRFVLKKKQLLDNYDLLNTKTLEYKADTCIGEEDINIELKINSSTNPKENNSKLQGEIESARKRLKRVEEYISSWSRSEFVKFLTKIRVPLVHPPITKTNMILKNPNFQICIKLWDYLLRYSIEESDNSKNGLDTTGNDLLKSFIDHSFLIDYYVLDSISSSKKEQKEKLKGYAISLINHEIERITSLLISSGIKITDEEILEMIANGMKNEKNKRLVGSDDVKKKFKSAMEEYLERTQDYL